MSAFTLDTSGAVAAPWGLYEEKIADHNITWPDLTPFEQGYVAQLFESLSVGGSCVGCLQTSFGEIHRCAFSDLHPDTLSAIRKDCAALVTHPFSYGRDATCGAYCWKMRQTDWRMRAALSDSVALRKRFPPQTPSLGDDGKVYLREGASA